MSNQLNKFWLGAVLISSSALLFSQPTQADDEVADGGKNSSTANAPAPVEEKSTIKGFHPIKRALEPVIRLEKNSSDMQKQIMNLRAPIANLEPTMSGLKGEMVNIDNHMNGMETSLASVKKEIAAVTEQMDDVGNDIHGMHGQLGNFKEPIIALQQPLNDLKKPLNNLSEPLGKVKKELADMRSLLGAVLAAIVISSIAVVVITPIFAIYLYKNRHRFLHHSDRKYTAARSSAAQTAEVVSSSK